MSASNKCPVCEKTFHWGADADSAVVDAQGERWVSCRENAFWKLNFHVKQLHPEILSECPRRAESFGMHDALSDFYFERDGRRVCSYCGSMHPDDFIKAVESGCKLGPTDKNYKVYVDLPHPHPEKLRVVSSQNFEPPDATGYIKIDNAELARKYGRSTWAAGHVEWIKLGPNGPVAHGKFYFQHLNDYQRSRFVELINSDKVVVGFPGHFYVLPYFCRRAGVAAG